MINCSYMPKAMRDHACQLPSHIGVVFVQRPKPAHVNRRFVPVSASIRSNSDYIGLQ
jgi:hypothetical protein